MRTQRPRTKTITATAARQAWSELLNAVSRGEMRVLVEKRGIPVAAIISTEDLRRLNQLEDEDRQAWDVLRAMREPFRHIPPEEIEQEAARALAEERTARRRKQRLRVTRR